MSAGPLFEIRDYNYRPERIDDYRAWARGAVPVLAELLDLVGFWIDAGIEARVAGSDPMTPRHGHPKTTWVIRWQDMEEREARWEALWEEPSWQDQWSRHPGFDDYLHMAVRFLHAA
ncbi:MAG: NIPSNAP family protein [Nitriliruptorales bacterium]|nr:NIPSNAP family protein [Nitriliruptorales bacterium]